MVILLFEKVSFYPIEHDRFKHKSGTSNFLTTHMNYHIFHDDLLVHTTALHYYKSVGRFQFHGTHGQNMHGSKFHEMFLNKNKKYNCNCK
jgi:hypothetical protein